MPVVVILQAEQTMTNNCPPLWLLHQLLPPAPALLEPLPSVFWVMNYYNMKQ